MDFNTGLDGLEKKKKFLFLAWSRATIHRIDISTNK